MLVDEKPPAELMQQWGSEREVWRRYWTEHDYYIHDQWIVKIRRIPKPTIAMVHGYAIFKGFNVAKAMDLVFATGDGLFLPSDTTIMWDIGHRKTLEVKLEHRFLAARECMDSHLVSRIYPDFETLESETLAFAHRVAENPASANRKAKEAVYRTMDMMGFTGDNFARDPFDVSFRQRDVPREERHRERHEGRGMARTPRAFTAIPEAPVGRRGSYDGTRAAARVDTAALERFA